MTTTATLDKLVEDLLEAQRNTRLKFKQQKISRALSRIKTARTLLDCATQTLEWANKTTDEALTHGS